MKNYIISLINAVFIENFVLVKFLGLCPFMGTSRKIETAIGMSMAITFVITIASILTWIINKYIIFTFNVPYLRTLAFIFIIAVVVQITELMVRNINLSIYNILGIFLPLITTNCAVLGVVLINANQNCNFLQSTLYGFNVAIGISLVLILFASINERIAEANVPKPFQGSAIALITAGIISLAFMGFNGILR